MDNQILEVSLRLQRLKYEMIDLEQILILLIGIDSKNRKQIKHL